MDLNGDLIKDIEGLLPHDPSFFTENCISILNDLILQLEKELIHIIGAVIAISGIINPKYNSIEESYVFNLVQYDFQKEISEKYPFPVFVENDANACAWGELFPQDPDNCTSFLYLLAKTTKYDYEVQADTGMAIGVGVVIDGNMIYGSHYCAGELKSALWEDSNSLRNPVSISPDRLADIHKNEKIFLEYIDEIFISLGPVVSVLDPEAIIIGGDLKDKILTIKQQLTSATSKYFLGREQSKYLINSPKKGRNEISAGAACMFLIRIFKQKTHHGKGIPSTHWKNIFKLKSSYSQKIDS